MISVGRLSMFKIFGKERTEEVIRKMRSTYFYQE
jgi:hypothetical protein